ncbi:MAG: endonuclease MutS2, partial [Clostridia bacterium]|nr:endonuclease MutS2 [Clostridia bacterium]
EEIADDATPELARIRRSIRKENERIRSQMQEMLKSKSAYLQDAVVTQRSGRYVLPVRADQRANVEGIIHERSATGATLFIEPASVVEANNRIRELEGAEKAEIARLLAQLSAGYAAYRNELRTDEQRLIELDLLFAKAALAREMRAVPVEFNQQHRVDISEGRHPLIDRNQVIPVTVRLQDGVTTLIITGPNTGGKTVMLKLIGLFAAMAQAGLYVPAGKTVQLPVFDGIYADIGDEQSIQQSLSTFSAHMKSIIYAIRHARGNALVLLDELGSGTDPQEGSALAQAILEDLHGKGALVVATTHIGELKDFAVRREGYENASMEWSAATLRPTYQLLMGVPGRSNALAIAKSLGLPRTIVTAAEGFMDTDAVNYTRLIEAAEKERSKAQANLRKSDEMLKEARRERDRAREQLRKTEEKRKRLLEQANQKALDIISDASSTAEAAIENAKKLHRQDSEAKRTKQTQRIREDLRDKRQTIQKHERRHKNYRPVDPDKLRPGDTVQIIPMDAAGTVLEPPNRKGLVKLQAGILTMELPASDLAVADEVPQQQKKQYLDRVDLDSRRDISLQLDLHGQTVDEAIVAVDRYLDDAFLAGLTEVAIVHGRGTGALRRGVTDFLRGHPHVKKMRTGEYNEGGMGATIVTLK